MHNLTQSFVFSLWEVWSGCVLSLWPRGFTLPNAILNTAPHRNQNSFLSARRWRQSWKIKKPKWDSICYPLLAVQMTNWVLCSHGNLQGAGQLQELVFNSLWKSGWSWVAQPMSEQVTELQPGALFVCRWFMFSLHFACPLFQSSMKFAASSALPAFQHMEFTSLVLSKWSGLAQTLSGVSS